MEIIPFKITKWVDFKVGVAQRRIFLNSKEYITINCTKHYYCIIYSNNVCSIILTDSSFDWGKLKSRKEVFDMALKYAVEKFK